MTETTVNGTGPAGGGRLAGPRKLDHARLRRRYAAETRFKAYGIIALVIAAAFLLILLGSIVSKGYSAFVTTEMRVPIVLDQTEVADEDWKNILRQSLAQEFPQLAEGQEVGTRAWRRSLDPALDLFSAEAPEAIAAYVREHPDQVGQTIPIWLPASDDIDMLVKGKIDRDVPEDDRRVKNNEIAMVDQLGKDDGVTLTFNTTFFTNGDSREPEQAGIWAALVGSFFTMIVTLALAFPIGVASAIYLEEFAPKNKWTDLIEVNINNLAAVPSIVFGLLGLAVFLNVFGLPRSAPISGGMVLALMTLPTIIIASRAALKAVPPSIREAAMGMGASRLQTVNHHVLPLAMPGILTGTIIGMAQALGETAPLLMIGMVAFIAQAPGSPLDPSSVLPVQIYMWSDSPERAFVEKTSAAIMVLLAFLILMNFLAVILRKRFERRW